MDCVCCSCAVAGSPYWSAELEMVRSYAEGGSLGFACPPAISKLVTLRMLVVSSGLLTPSKLVVVDASKRRLIVVAQHLC